MSPVGGRGPNFRSRICDGSRLLRIDLEEEWNAVNEGVISMAANRVVVRVIPTDEERMIAKTVCCVPGLGWKKEN